jgi:hypothetical protein
MSLYGNNDLVDCRPHSIIMSAESIARWNAIPMTRPEHDGLSTHLTSTKVLLVLLLPF